MTYAEMLGAIQSVTWRATILEGLHSLEIAVPARHVGEVRRALLAITPWIIKLTVIPLSNPLRLKKREYSYQLDLSHLFQ